jgi:5'-nucleotidase
MTHYLIDQDGVLADWSLAFETDFKLDYPHIDAPLLNDNVNWDMTAGLDEEGKAAVQSVMVKPGFYAKLSPIPGAKEALNAMIAEGHQVSIVTSPYVGNPTCASDKIAWLEEHIGAGWGHKAVITSDKTVVMGDILIDDRPNITGIYNPVWEHVLFDAPYNLAHTNGRRRLSKWEDWRTLTALSERVVVDPFVKDTV